jgi:glycosyltransferase involved in cell wall biosynthesis
MSPRLTRILFCESNVDGTVGGSYYSLLFLVRGLDPSRYRALVVFYNDHSLVPAFREAGADVRIWERPSSLSFGRGLTGWLRPVGLLVGVLRKALNFWNGLVHGVLKRAWFLRRQNVHLVHLNNSIQSSHDWMLAALITRTACVCHERGINTHYGSLSRFLGRRLDAIICISGAVRTAMISAGAGFPNLATIHNGLDPTALRFQLDPEELRQAFGLPAGAPLLCMVGNIKPWKGQETVVRAMAEVTKTFPTASCLLVGDTSPSDREYESFLHQLIESHGLSQRVIFTGFQKYPADFMRLVDIVLHTSVQPEPFGRVLLEAMACRKPIIGAHAGAVPEIIEEGTTGLTFAPGDAAALAGAIAALLGDPARASEMGEQGYRRLLAEFPISRNIESTQKLYDAALADAR